MAELFSFMDLRKNNVGNVSSKELGALKKLAKVMLAYSEAELETIAASGTLIEVECNGKAVSQ